MIIIWPRQFYHAAKKLSSEKLKNFSGLKIALAKIVPARAKNANFPTYNIFSHNARALSSFI
jgi:hypothetical protein